jgi:solute carrier family 34 (sodium-dependent phosphate cotransporter)
MNLIRKIAQNTLVKVILIIAFLYLFLSAITMMSAAFKLMGHAVSTGLMDVTASPVVALFMGLLMTAIIQSSSVTTSLVVGLVSAGTISVANAVPIVMGANIGTTITNILVSIGHIGNKREFRRAFAGATMHDFFNLIAVAVFFPLELATGFLSKSAEKVAALFYGTQTSLTYHSPIKSAAKFLTKLTENILLKSLHLHEKVTGIILLVLAFVLIFVSLYFIVKIMRSIMIKKIERMLNRFLNKSAFIGISIGIVITVLVQSSSITTSLLVPLMGTGLLTMEAAFPITLGANVGTTVTAILASLAGNMAGLTIAFVHLLFNISGIVMVYPIRRIRRIPLYWSAILAKKATENKKVIIYFVLGIFFALPLIVIFIEKLLKNF